MPDDFKRAVQGSGQALPHTAWDCTQATLVEISLTIYWSQASAGDDWDWSKDTLVLFPLYRIILHIAAWDWPQVLQTQVFLAQDWPQASTGTARAWPQALLVYHITALVMLHTAARDRPQAPPLIYSPAQTQPQTLSDFYFVRSLLPPSNNRRVVVSFAHVHLTAHGAVFPPLSPSRSPTLRGLCLILEILYILSFSSFLSAGNQNFIRDSPLCPLSFS